MAENEKNGTSHDHEVSHDTLFDGSVICRQHVEGYRFSIDSVLLAHSPTIRNEEQILDLGTGCGVIGLIMCYRHAEKNISVTGLELQSALADLARANIFANGYEEKFSVIDGSLQDCRSLIEPESYSLVTANPPFFSSGTGRLSSNQEAMTARHQEVGGLSIFVEAASYSVKNRGRVIFVYPANLAVPLVYAFQENRLVPKRMQVIYSYPGIEMASLVLVEGVKNGGTGLEIMEPLYIYGYRNGPYSETVMKMFQPD
ncbi:MAG: methyltransferase [Desulfofustis sp.]|nr:methyltransferase [Desulfofustis sp.]NNK14946.1 methyltransferase [Desulfofustis sp.]